MRGNICLRIFDYEEGKLDFEQTRELFQELLDTGLIWYLQGSYQRTAQAMLDAGEIERDENYD